MQTNNDMIVLSMKVTNSNYGIEHNAYEGMREKREVQQLEMKQCDQRQIVFSRGEIGKGGRPRVKPNPYL